MTVESCKECGTQLQTVTAYLDGKPHLVSCCTFNVRHSVDGDIRIAVEAVLFERDQREQAWKRAMKVPG